MVRPDNARVCGTAISRYGEETTRHARTAPGDIFRLRDRTMRNWTRVELRAVKRVRLEEIVFRPQIDSWPIWTIPEHGRAVNMMLSAIVPTHPETLNNVVTTPVVPA